MEFSAFDASKLPVEENLRQTKLVVAEAREYGAHVEGEIESITGVEDGIGSDEVDRIQPLEVALNFIKESQVDVFAPAIGNAHGRYLVEPVLDADRVKKFMKQQASLLPYTVDQECLRPNSQNLSHLGVQK